MRILLLAVCCLVAVCPRAFATDALRALPILRRGIIADLVGLDGAHVIDVDGDGLSDVVTCAAGAPFVLRYVNGTYRTYWQGPSIACSGIAVGDRDGDGGMEIIVGTQTGLLYVFDPRSAGPALATATATVSGQVADVAAGNVDGDAGLEIVVVLADATLVYDAATLAVEWTATGYGGWTVGIGDVDGDPVLEIVVNGDTGSVLNASTQTLEWGYAGGFGNRVQVGNADTDARAEIVFLEAWSDEVTILNGDTFLTSTVTLESTPDVIGLGDSNGDGINEILAGDNQWGGVSGYDSGTSTKLWEVGNPEHGVHFVHVADLNGDGGTEVIWGAGSSSSGKDALFIGDTATEEITFESEDLDGSFSSTAADLDSSGSQEWLVATLRSDSGYQGGTVEVVDFPSGATSSFSRGVYPESYGYIYKVATGQLDADPAKEMLLLGDTLRAVDGVTLASEWVSGSFMGYDVYTHNVDGDAVDEIIAAMSDNKVVVLNGASNVIQASRAFTGYLVDLVVADTDGTGLPEVIVATSSHLTVLSLPTLALRREIAISSLQQIAGSAVGGGTIAATFSSGSRIRTFAASDLSARWSCSSFSETFNAITFAVIGGHTRLLAVDQEGLLRSFRFDAADCAVGETATLPLWVHSITTGDITQDGRLELLVDTESSSEIILLGLPSEARGEVTGDGLLTGADAERLTDYIFGTAAGLAPGGDVNADGRIAPEDIFALVHHLFDGGPAPQP